MIQGLVVVLIIGPTATAMREISYKVKGLVVALNIGPVAAAMRGIS